MATFERILWRALRGNLYLNHAEIDEPITDPTNISVKLQKNVFVIFAHGREILSKIRKISESLGATLYPVDNTLEARRDAALQVMSRLEDFQSVLDTTGSQRKHELSLVADNLAMWLSIVRKEKAVYHTMNLFSSDSGSRCLIAEGWCPTNQFPEVQASLRYVTVKIFKLMI